MTDFRVGDRVEIVHTVWQAVYNWKRGVIVKIDGGECWMKFDPSQLPMGPMEDTACVPLHALAHISAVDRLSEVADD